MWRYYTRLNAQGHQTAALEAEHLALTLFAIHQQSKAKPMHRVGDGLGTAVLALRNDSSSSPEAVDRRFAAAATATSLAEIGMHLRGLISQLRRIDQPLDYTLLMRDLAGWQDPDRRARTRRRWGGQYFAGRKDETDDSVSDAD
jgi:CRISPR system Cascade subunit CasB